ncbi:MAG: hypothetical protein IT287_04995, partial [Bdellovibrionaceae bacterium]|nr:hypothetical protein [Pseudobdellovibrionaceae bacterium]
AGRNENETQLIKTYPVFAISGTVGPKLNEKDQQVPEGVYRLESLNPNDHFYLALKVNYPNEFDREMALRDGRDSLGTEVMIHGESISTGGVAIGNDAIEELFVLAALTEYSSWRLIFAPVDLRTQARSTNRPLPDWVSELDQQLLREFLTLQ